MGSFKDVRVFQVKLEFFFLFLVEGGNKSTRRKTLGAGTKTDNKLSLHLPLETIYRTEIILKPNICFSPHLAGFEPRVWGPNTLITAPSLLSMKDNDGKNIKNNLVYGND